MTSIKNDPAALTQLLDQLFSDDLVDRLDVDVSRGYERKGVRDTRDPDTAPSRYSQGDDDTIVVTIELAEHDDGDFIDSRSADTFLTQDAYGDPAIHIRVEFGTGSELGQRFLALADAEIDRTIARKTAGLIAARDKIQSEIDELNEKRTITAPQHNN